MSHPTASQGQSSVAAHAAEAQHGHLGSTNAGEAIGAASAPSGSSWGGMVNSASSLLGGQSETLGQAAQLAQTFDQLGLTPDMVGKFAKVTVDYVTKTGGADLAQLLAGALPL